MGRANGTGSRRTMEASVCGPTMPSRLRCIRCCMSRTPRSVGPSKYAFTGTLIPWRTSRNWSTATSQPNSPRRSERGEALFRILAREQVSELVGFLLERARREVEQPLRDPQRHRALGGKLRGDLERVVEHGIGDRVHEPDPQRLFSVDRAAGEDQL